MSAQIDEAKLEAFMGQAVTDMGAVVSAPLMTRSPPSHRMAMPANPVSNPPSAPMLIESFCSEKTDCTSPTRRCSPVSIRERSAPKALNVSTPETSSTM